MPSPAQELASTLEEEGRKTVEFFRSLASHQWDMQVYDDGPAWKVHNLLAHFTEVEGSIARLIRSVMDGGPGVAEGFDIDRWNAEHTEELSLQDRDILLEEFTRRRAATVEMVRGFTEGDMEKIGRHPALGGTEVKHMIRLMYIHLQGHQRDIKRALKAAAAES
ncbi:MAG: DinB family protein [Anaerolineales bacterium]